MAIRLHTAVADEIHKIAQTDPERAAEMRATSIEYANEVRGFYDEEVDPYDRDDESFEFDDPEPDDITEEEAEAAFTDESPG